MNAQHTPTPLGQPPLATIRRALRQVSRAIVAAAVLALPLFAGGCFDPEPATEVATEEPIRTATASLPFDDGEGPAALAGFDLFAEEGPDGGAAVALVYLDAASFGRVLEDPAFQIRVYLERPGGDAIAFYQAGRTWLVSEQFEVLSRELRVDFIDELSAIQLELPACPPRQPCSGVAELAWDDAPTRHHTTPVRGLPYLGTVIGSEPFPPVGDSGGRPMSEIYLTTVPGDGCHVTTRDCPAGTDPQTCEPAPCDDGTSGTEVRESGVKGWPAGPGETRRDPNAPANHPVYVGWPKTPRGGGFTFWEFEGAAGFLKYAQEDLNGNGRKDAGECWGFVGRCPYDPGKNRQAIGPDSSKWTSEHDGHGKRMVYELRRKADGGCEVVATHQTLRNGSWEDTRVGAGFQNPVVGGPYDSERAIPSPASFGQ